MYYTSSKRNLMHTCIIYNKIASHDLEILNVNARFPGSVHDSFIWRHSTVRDEMQRLYDSGDRTTWLLGKYHDYFIFIYLIMYIKMFI